MNVDVLAGHCRHQSFGHPWKRRQIIQRPGRAFGGYLRDGLGLKVGHTSPCSGAAQGTSPQVLLIGRGALEFENLGFRYRPPSDDESIKCKMTRWKHPPRRMCDFKVTGWK